MAQQTDASKRPNTTRVLDMIEWHLRNFSIANGDYIEDIGVDRLRDPRLLWQNTPQDLRDKGTIVRIKAGDWKKVSGEMGGNRRKLQTVELYCFQSLGNAQDDSQVSIDLMQDWLRHDIEKHLAEDMLLGFQQAVGGLNQQKGPWGDAGTWGKAPSCINLQVTEGIIGPYSHPRASMLIRLQYLFDEAAPGGVPGFQH
jgi:hypothetical protein